MLFWLVLHNSEFALDFCSSQLKEIQMENKKPVKKKSIHCLLENISFQAAFHYFIGKTLNFNFLPAL